ncbi:unnamed protein product [Nippostrongylus brasiliensis]|uniref:Ovule protein n=1 Tax=Nippostrongylus brasiliensis TaxID=27835 RepID=A0A0N4XSP9_NIPBR|nr:unnamed protein product [Nippostrongylus brasiliensis]
MAGRCAVHCDWPSPVSTEVSFFFSMVVFFRTFRYGMYSFGVVLVFLYVLCPFGVCVCFVIRDELRSCISISFLSNRLLLHCALLFFDEPSLPY